MGYSSKTVGPVVEEDEFRKLIAPKITSKATSVSDRCAFLKRLEVDFNQHTLLTYGVNGDCFVRAKARVIRNDSNKSYVLRITKIFGGCRAAGNFEGWLVIEKVPPDYKIEVELFERDDSGVTQALSKPLGRKNAATLRRGIQLFPIRENYGRPNTPPRTSPQPPLFVRLR